MTLRRLTAADFQRMPWKNGGGETLQLAIWPPEADLDTFDWRITSARVAGSGPFSPFPGIDRSLALLSGAALTLRIADVHASTPRILTLHPGQQLDQFAGETPIVAELAANQVLLDFNVMTRRGRYRHRLLPLTLAGEQIVDRPLWLVYLTAGSLRAAPPATPLLAGELLWGQGAATLGGRAEGWLVEIDAG